MVKYRTKVGDIMFELDAEEINNLLKTNKEILGSIKSKRKTHLLKTINLINRNNLLANKNEQTLTPKNQQELANFDEELDQCYALINPLTNRIIWHDEIRKLLLHKNAESYINPLELYHYYISRGNRLTLLKLFVIVSQNNIKFLDENLGTLGRLEKLLGAIPNENNIEHETIINIFSNYLAILEIEYQNQMTSVFNRKRLHEVNKELIAILKRHLLSSEIISKPNKLDFKEEKKISTTDTISSQELQLPKTLKKQK